MKKSLLPKTRTIQDLLNESKSPNYKGRNSKSPETGPLRLHKPAIYNVKRVENPVLSNSDVEKLKGTQTSETWTPEY